MLERKVTKRFNVTTAFFGALCTFFWVQFSLFTLSPLICVVNFIGFFSFLMQLVSFAYLLGFIKEGELSVQALLCVFASGKEEGKSEGVD